MSTALRLLIKQIIPLYSGSRMPSSLQLCFQSKDLVSIRQDCLLITFDFFWASVWGRKHIDIGGAMVVITRGGPQQPCTYSTIKILSNKRTLHTFHRHYQYTQQNVLNTKSQKAP